jgi:hypothetical protein
MLSVLTMSFDGWLTLWWVTIPLALFFVGSVGHTIYRRIPLTRASAALCLFVPVSAVVFAAIAVLFAADQTSPTAVQDAVLPVRALGVLGTATAVAAAACVLLAKNQRIVAASVALFGGWLAYWVFFVAAMSVSGVWL